MSPVSAGGAPDAVLAAGLPWLEPVLRQALALNQAHALLLHAAPGDGAWQAAQRIAAAWLCEAAADRPRPCGDCESCRLLAEAATQGLHPDLHRLLPADLRQELGLAAEGGAGNAAGGVLATPA
jgi:DNA polymerase-3 subunit delta'